MVDIGDGPNGVKMADAKRADVQYAVDTYAPQAADMLHKASYYRAVLAKLPDGKKVADVFDDKGLTGIYEATRPGVEAPKKESRVSGWARPLSMRNPLSGCRAQ